MEAYCFKCKTKREMNEPQAVFTVTGTGATLSVTDTILAGFQRVYRLRSL